jgi:hypothetical protein
VATGAERVLAKLAADQTERIAGLEALCSDCLTERSNVCITGPSAGRMIKSPPDTRAGVRVDAGVRRWPHGTKGKRHGYGLRSTQMVKSWQTAHSRTRHTPGALHLDGPDPMKSNRRRRMDGESNKSQLSPNGKP